MEIGDIVISIICPSKQFTEFLKDYFGIENSTKSPDIQLKLNIIQHKDNINIPDSLFTDKIIDGFSFMIGDDHVSGYFNPDKKTGYIIVKATLTTGLFIRVFEQLLYQAYYSAVKIKNSNSFLVHSAGVIYKDEGFLFFGPSESGKSTIATISREYHVLNDEVCLINKNTEKIYLHYTPFNGFFKLKRAGHAELKAMFYIEHGNINEIIESKESIAIKLLAKEIIPPIGLNEAINPSTFLKMIDIAEMLYKKVSVKKLKFLPDIKFWDLIDELYF